MAYTGIGGGGQREQVVQHKSCNIKKVLHSPLISRSISSRTLLIHEPIHYQPLEQKPIYHIFLTRFPFAHENKMVTGQNANMATPIHMGSNYPRDRCVLLIVFRSESL